MAALLWSDNTPEMADHQPPSQPSLPLDVAMPPNFTHSRQPGALQDPSSLLDIKDSLRASRSYTMSSAVSETTSCMTFYSALGTTPWNGKLDEVGPPPFNERRKINGYEDLQIEGSDSGSRSVDSPTDTPDSLRGEASGPGDSTAKLMGKSHSSSDNTQSVRRDDNAHGTRRRSSTSDRSNSRPKEHNRTESSTSRAASSRRSGSSVHRRSSNTDPKAKPGPERPVSKRSSKSFKGVSGASRTRPQLPVPTRGSSSTLSRRWTDGPATKQQAPHMFQSLGATLASYSTAHTEPRSDLRSRSVSAFRHSAPIPVGDLPYLMAAHIDQNSPHAQDVPPPSTVIDWKSPTTRRREYAEIDKRDRGFRGWWRRWSPSWCSRSPRHVFYEGSKSDAGSVRRYRLELPDEDVSVDAQENEKSMEVSAGRVRFSWPRIHRTWSCFNLREEPSGRWPPAAALTKYRNSSYSRDVWELPQ